MSALGGIEEPGLLFKRKRSELRVEKLPERCGITSWNEMGIVDDEEEFGLILDARGGAAVDKTSEGVRWHGVHDARSNELMPTELML